jgi:hypothetical protein
LEDGNVDDHAAAEIPAVTATAPDATLGQVHPLAIARARAAA